MSRRYAIYYAPPPGSDLGAFGRRWLGRDHVTGEPVEPLKLDDIDAAQHMEITRSARHYGFHATLKAPFELAVGKETEELYARARLFASAREKFETPPLEIAKISRWVAFVLSSSSEAMNELAADCVRDFEDFRAPLSDVDIDRRRRSGLSPRQDEQLLAFGYPYIFDDFQFHMTLAGPMESVQQEKVHHILQAVSPPFEQHPFIVDAIAIYEQPSRDLPFIQTARLPFGEL
jgi:putative phosphonate metabolism protein